MSMPICARCKKNMAVVFITKLENGKTVNEGLCLKCAKELGIKPVADLLDKFGLKDSDLDGLTPAGIELIPQENGDIRLMNPDSADLKILFVKD